jgi:cytochrome c-type biogenesis protein CcmH/NrfG
LIDSKIEILKEKQPLKNETLLIAVVALIVGLLGGYLVFSISSNHKEQQAMPVIPAGSGTPNDYVRRIAEAEKIVAQDPKNVTAWISLGNDYFDTDQAQKAINAYAKALELDPNNTNVLTDQGVMFRSVGWFDKAIANFDKVLKIDPKHLQSLKNMGVVYSIDLKQPEKAVPYWKRYVEVDPTSATGIQIKGMIEQHSKGTSPATK